MGWGGVGVPASRRRPLRIAGSCVQNLKAGRFRAVVLRVYGLGVSKLLLGGQIYLHHNGKMRVLLFTGILSPGRAGVPEAV